MGGATADVLLKWLTIPCDEERHYGFICEQAPERIYPLDCVSVVIGTKSDFACDRAPHSHLVSCTCPCHKFSIYGNTCNCECDTPGITVRCCDLTGKISGGRGSDQVMETALDCTTLKVGYTMSTSDALCPIDFPTMVSCTSNSDKMPLIVGNSRCDGETLNNAVCCRITAKKQEIFEKTLSKMAAPSVDTQVKSVEECERQCADDPLCMAYNSVSTCSFTLEGSEQNSVGVTLAECHTECNGDEACLDSLQFFFDCKGFYSNIVPMFEEGYKKREPYSQFSAFTVLPDLMFDPNIEATYSRALAGRSVGVADMNLCVHSCSETKGCEAVDHGEDDMCYHVQNTSQCCVLLTNKTYTQYNMDFKQHDSDIMSSWLLVHAKSRCTVREGSPASCMGDEMLVSCGCSTQSGTPTISGSPASCECQPESSAKAICCKIINSPRNAPMACSPGMMVEDHVCTQCTGHTYTGNYHQTECLPCPEGAISTPFNSYCEYCPVGSVPNANKTACEKCEIGYNTNGPGDPYCTVINCQAPQNFANTTWNALSFTYGNIASYFCNPGFVVSNGTGFKICSCDGNWIGDEEFVCSELDECLSDACQNNATCTDAVDGYNCTCQAGYTGVHCETDIDECASDPCVDGTCYDFVNEHNCSCDPGFFGIICDMEINECSSNPCHFGGTCLDFVNYYICYCVNGTNGTHCENDIDECASCPCQNGGTCYDSLDSYNCSCAPGFEGANCQINIDECDSDPCQNNGSCLDLVNSYNCTCLETFNGTHCENELLCQDIRNISHLVVDLDYYPVYGFEGNVSCTQGRKLSSNVSSGIACLITQEWNNTIPPDACVLEDCPDVHSFTNMIATSVPYIHKYTHNTTVTCAEGFKLPTDFPEVITCTKTKEWSYNITNSTCINKECPDIRPFPHLLVDNDTFTTLYPYTGNISCEYPWELAPGISEQITCLLTELWDPDITTGVCVESNFCESNPCQHNGNCTRYFGGYNCTCEPGYFGTHCENATDECEPKPCLNGECFDLHLDYTCYCVNGYEGKDCQNLVNCSTPPPIVHADYVVGNTTYQSNVSYICHLGYEAVNATMLKTCHWNGTWVGDNFTCEDIDDCLNSTCPHNATCMDQVNNHTCICPVGYIGKFCHIALDYCLRYPCQNNGTCSNGLKGPGLFDCTCQQGWQGRLCQNGIDCFDPPYVSRARYLPHSATNLSSMVEYQCKTPYVKSNATTGIKTCMASGNWEGADIICEDPPIPTTTPRPPDAPTVPPTEPPIITIPVECPQPTIGPHTSVHAVLGDLQVGAIIRYECDFGYWISSSHTRQKILTCTDFHNNGVWVPYVELCVAVVCAAMPDPVGVMFPSWMLRFLTYEYTTMLTFSCEPGLAFPDTSKKRSAFCTADAVWSNQIPDCEKVSCPAHPPGLKVTSIKPGEDLLECPQEHTSFPSGLPFSMETCSSLGTWIPGNTRCFSSCSVPPEVDTMELRESVSTHIGAKLKLWCKPGFRLQFGHTYIEITCLDNHKWYPEDIEPCAEKRCPQVPGIGNATSSSQAVFVDTTVEYTCDTGYYFNLTKTSTYSVYCQPNETWSWYPETCIEIHCGEPPSGVSGNMIQNYTTDTYGSLATYTCLENHRFTDGSEVMSLPCQENGTWQAMTDTCQLGRCPPQPDVQGALPDRMEATVGTKVTYTCEEGYTFPTQSPTETIECHQNLSWTKIQEGCTRVLCPEIDEVPNLEVSGKAYGHAYGESRNVSCGVGYRLKNHDSATITCLANGQWSQTIDNSTCIPVECPELRSVQYAYAQGITGHKYGDTATYFCYLEFEFPNKEWFRQIHCTANGTWSARVEMGCIVVSCGRLLSPAITLNTTRHTVNTAMTSTCPEGYLFADGLATHISKCHANGSWYPQVDIVCHIAHKVRQILFEVEEAPVSASIGILSCGLVLVTVFLVVGTDVFGCVVSIMAKKQAASLMQQTTGAKIKEIAP